MCEILALEQAQQLHRRHHVCLFYSKEEGGWRMGRGGLDIVVPGRIPPKHDPGLKQYLVVSCPDITLTSDACVNKGVLILMSGVKGFEGFCKVYGGGHRPCIWTSMKSLVRAIVGTPFQPIIGLGL